MKRMSFSPFKYVLPIAFFFAVFLWLSWSQNPTDYPLLMGGNTLVSDTICTPCTTIDTAVGLDFSGQTLTDSNFTVYAKDHLVNANFSGAILSGAQFQNMDLSGADFSNAVLNPSAKGKTNFSGAILKGTCFLNANADSCDLQFATLQGTNFTCASLVQATFGPVLNIIEDTVRTKFVNTVLDIPNFPLNSFQQDSTYWGLTDFSYARFNGLTQTNINFESWYMANAILTGINLTGFDLAHCNLENAVIDNAVLLSVDLDSTYMVGITMDNTNLTLASLDYVTLYDTTSTDSVTASFNAATLLDANMVNTMARYVEFRAANFTGANVSNTDFQRAVFSPDSTYTEAVFNTIQADSALFNYADLNSIQASNAVITNCEFKYLTIANGSFFRTVLSGSTFEYSTLEAVSFNEGTLHNVNFSNTTIKGTNQGGNVEFTCAYLGGSNFTSSEVLSATFADAVIPPIGECCPQVDSTYDCGLDAHTQLPYGKTILPELTTTVICPNQDRAICDSVQWRIPDWRTNDCNSSRKTVTMWAPPACGTPSDSSGYVIFPDSSMQKCIADNFFNGDTTRLLDTAAATQVLSLSCPGYQITNPSGLQYLTNLEELDLSDNQITDINIWTYLTNLKKLNLESNALAQINLEGLTTLVQLDVSDNQLTTVSGATFLELWEVDLSNNQLTTFPLNESQYCYFADLSHNLLTSVGSLTENNYLITLYLENNSLTNIGSLASATGLRYANLSCNPDLNCDSLGTSINTYCGENNLPECD